jgi:hypothetical protein
MNKQVIAAVSIFIIVSVTVGYVVLDAMIKQMPIDKNIELYIAQPNNYLIIDAPIKQAPNNPNQAHFITCPNGTYIVVITGAEPSMFNTQNYNEAVEYARVHTEIREPYIATLAAESGTWYIVVDPSVYQPGLQGFFGDVNFADINHVVFASTNSTLVNSRFINEFGKLPD